jgi:hypothetical protein
MSKFKITRTINCRDTIKVMDRAIDDILAGRVILSGSS